MTLNERKHLSTRKMEVRTKYSKLASFLTSRIKDINAGELILPEGLEELYNRELVKEYGSSTKKGRLQEELDACFDGVLTSLKKDFPYFTGQQIQVFSLLAAGFPYYLVAKLSGLSSVNAVWVMKTKMKETFTTTYSSRREEYLIMLEK